MKKNLFFLFVATISPVVMAQQVVTGRITDAEDRTPVQGASIFIANTTIGTTSDTSGNYSITVTGTGSFEIVVSHVGYKSVVRKFDTPKETHQYNVALKIIELQEITISATKTYSKRDVDLFWHKILGESPSKSGMQTLNPEKVYFYKKDNVLKAMCSEPIEIINHKMGYHIQYILQRFEYDYRSKKFTLFGVPHFKEIIPKDDRQKDQWNKKRQEVYTVSLIHFMRTLYRKQILEEGFLLLNRDQSIQGKLSPVPLEDILQTGQDIALLTIIEPLFLICVSTPVSAELVMSSYNLWMKESMPMIVLLPQQIKIYPDGSYTGLLVADEYQGSLLGLSSTVPVEYADKLPDFDPNTKPVETEIDREIIIEKNMTAQLEVYPQEKIHLHTDRDYYIPGEKIRFKAYVVDANSHQNQTESWYVYVELINPADSLVKRVMITQTDDGMFHGYLPVSDIIPEGNYTLRAYTRYMENMGDDYFFKKNIRIGNLSSANNQQQQTAQCSGSSTTLKNRNSTTLSHRNEDDFDVSFFPEGGNLPEGVFCKVAFKAINKTGYPETVTGTLIDHAGVEMTSVHTNYTGMGILGYRPEAGKRYQLKCKNANGLEKQFELPRSNPHACSLAVTQSGDNHLFIEQKRSVRASDTPCFLLVHCRGTVVFYSEWNDKRPILLSMEDLPAGVIQIVLFDIQMNPISERLIFSKKDADTKVEFQTDRYVYQRREKIIATLSILDSLFYSSAGHFSIAVTDDHDIAVDKTTTILSSLLISSELKGYIENPAYYLQDDDAMDLLMMTHGWRRYNVPDAVKGRFEKPKIPFQLFQEISGQVKTLNSRRFVPDCEIFVITKFGGLGVTADRNGSFTVPELDFPDSTTFYISALRKNGRDNVKLTVDRELFPAPVYAPQSPMSIILTPTIETNEEPNINNFMVKAEQRANFDEDIWLLQFKEIEVMSSRIKKTEPRGQFWANSSSDHTITRETFKQIHHTSVADYLTSVSNIRVLENGEVYIRRNDLSSFQGVDKGLPLVLIDGVEHQWPDRLYSKHDSPVERVPVSDIESIDIFKNGAIFGMRGAFGAISITTKRGINSGFQTDRFNHVVYYPLGYQKPVAFYSPEYENLQAKQSVIPDFRTTIFWKPDLVISDNEETSFEFYTSDFKTTYSVVIEGITNDGRIIRQVEKIRVE